MKTKRIMRLKLLDASGLPAADFTAGEKYAIVGLEGNSPYLLFLSDRGYKLRLHGTRFGLKLKKPEEVEPVIPRYNPKKYYDLNYCD